MVNYIYLCVLVMIFCSVKGKEEDGFFLWNVGGWSYG